MRWWMARGGGFEHRATPLKPIINNLKISYEHRMHVYVYVHVYTNSFKNKNVYIFVGLHAYNINLLKS